MLTNQRHASAKELVTRYAQRMLIENALSDAVRFFHMDALFSSGAPEGGLRYGSVGAGQRPLLPDRPTNARLRDAQARQILRDLINLSAQVEVSQKEVSVTFHRVLTCRSSSLPIWWTSRSQCHGGTGSIALLHTKKLWRILSGGNPGERRSVTLKSGSHAA
jgi:GTPase involved in cell partitioning and DNA repair